MEDVRWGQLAIPQVTGTVGFTSLASPRGQPQALPAMGAPAQSPGTECPQLGGLTGGSLPFWGDLNALPHQLADVLPWLSSFGHAKTVLNANASRFGEALRLCLQR